MGWGKVKKICFFLWSVKSVFLLPWDIYTDVRLAMAHWNNGNHMWGVLTFIFLIPSLCFPYHYYHIIKCILLKFNNLFNVNFLFKNPSKADIRDQEKRKIWLNGMFAYFEDIPQFILQVYILWITPFECFTVERFFTEENSLNNLDKVKFAHSILSSFLSIASHIVPFYEIRRNEEWKLFSVNGFFLHFISGVFLNTVPKLVLISWTFSVLNWYGWLFVMALFMISGLAILFLYQKRFDDVNRSSLLFRTPMSKLLLTMQITFGYAGGRRGFIISALLLTCFLIPLGITLSAVLSTSFLEENDSFAIFPRNPYPSRTICFTNASKIKQEIQWSYREDKFSNDCNFTYSAVSCAPEHREFLITQLSFMIGVMSAGPLILVMSVMIAIFLFYIAKVIKSRKSSHSQEMQDIDSDDALQYIRYLFEEEEDLHKKLFGKMPSSSSSMYWYPFFICENPSCQNFFIWLVKLPFWFLLIFFEIAKIIFYTLSILYICLTLFLPGALLYALVCLMFLLFEAIAGCFSWTFGKFFKKMKHEQSLFEYLTALFNFV